MSNEKQNGHRKPATLTSFLTYRLSRLQNQLNAQAINLLRTHSDISLTEWRIILTVSSSGPLTLSDLVDLILLDKGQLSRAIKLLVEKDYLATQTLPTDHRSHLLSLTPDGKSLRDEVLPLMQQRQSTLSEQLSDDELDTFYTVIGKLECAAKMRAP